MSFSSLADSALTAEGVTFSSGTCGFVEVTDTFGTSSIAITGKSFISVTSELLSVISMNTLSSSTIDIRQSSLTAAVVGGDGYPVIWIGSVQGSANAITTASIDHCAGCGVGGADVEFSVTGFQFLYLDAGVPLTSSLSVSVSSSVFDVANEFISAIDRLHNFALGVMDSSVTSGLATVSVTFSSSGLVDSMTRCSFTITNSVVDSGDSVVYTTMALTDASIEVSGSQLTAVYPLLSVARECENILIVFRNASQYTGVGELFYSTLPPFTTRNLTVAISEASVISISDYDVIGVYDGYEVTVNVSGGSQVSMEGLAGYGSHLLSGYDALYGISVEMSGGSTFSGITVVYSLIEIGTTLASDGVTVVTNSIRVVTGASLSLVDDPGNAIDGGIVFVDGGDAKLLEVVLMGSSASLVTVDASTSGWPLVHLSGSMTTRVVIAFDFATVTTTTSPIQIADTTVAPQVQLTNSHFTCGVSVFHEAAVPAGGSDAALNF
ncbi:Hypothetical protein, putative, partial [Bodo saltans]